MAEFKIKFWGVRGSYPVSGEKFVKYGGNTTCISMEIADKILIFDAGTGLINLGSEIIKEKKYNVMNMFFTHTHIDHVQGLPYFTPAYSGKKTLNVLGPTVFDKNIEEVLATLMSYQFFPVKLNQLSCNMRAFHISDNQVIILRKGEKIPLRYNKFHDNYVFKEGDVIVRMLREPNHPVGGVSIYKVEYKDKVVVFATDLEGYIGGNTNLIKFAKDADILIHDCAYSEEEYLTKQGWGHSTPLMAVTNAKKANVKKLFLTHHEPYETDEVISNKLEVARKNFINSFLAYEGLEIELL